MDTEPGLEAVEAGEENKSMVEVVPASETMEDLEEEIESMVEVEVVPESEAMEDLEENSEHSEGTKETDVVQIQSDEDDEDNENTDDFPAPQFPVARVKKIMQYCMAAEDEEEEQEVTNAKGAKGQGKGKGSMIITKEAIYLTTLATEHFISVIGQMAGNVTMSSKKKTLTMEHLKRALSDTDAFAFLEGCFQPSVIIGD